MKIVSIASGYVYEERSDGIYGLSDLGELFYLSVSLHSSKATYLWVPLKVDFFKEIE